MKKLFSITLYFFFLCNVLLSQDYWQYVEVPDSITYIKDIVISPTGDVLLCTNHGIYSSEDDGHSWNHLGDIYSFIAALAFQNDSLWYASNGMAFLKSENCGLTWDTIVTYSHNLNKLILINDSLLFEPCWGGIYKSSDWGYTWDQVLVTSEARAFYDIIEYNGHLYCSSIGFIFSEYSGLYKSTDNGETWDLHSLQYYGCYPLFVDDQNNLLVGIVAAWPSGHSPGLFSTKNPDMGWDAIYNEGEVLSIAQDSTGGLFIGLQSDVIPQWGIRLSNDYGNSWSNLNSGLFWSANVEDIEISGNNFAYSLYSHNVRDSIYRSVNPIVAINEGKSSQDRSPQITLYPNPCHDKINLLYNEKSKFLSVTIYNIFGQKMFSRQFLNTSGSFQHSFEFRNYPSGIYLIEFITESHHLTSTIIKQ